MATYNNSNQVPTQENITQNDFEIKNNTKDMPIESKVENTNSINLNGVNFNIPDHVIEMETGIDYKSAMYGLVYGEEVEYYNWSTDNYNATLIAANEKYLKEHLDLEKDIGAFGPIPGNIPITLYDYSCGPYTEYEMYFEINDNYYAYRVLSYISEEEAMKACENFYNANSNMRNLDYNFY